MKPLKAQNNTKSFSSNRNGNKKFLYHKGHVLTAKEISQNRSSAYKYLF